MVDCADTGNTIRMLGYDGVVPLASFLKTIDINLVGTFSVLQLGAEQIAKTKPIGPAGEEYGVIINIAPVAAFDGQRSAKLSTPRLKVARWIWLC